MIYEEAWLVYLQQIINKTKIKVSSGLQRQPVADLWFGKALESLVCSRKSCWRFHPRSKSAKSTYGDRSKLHCHSRSEKC